MEALHRFDVEAVCGEQAIADGSIVLAEQAILDDSP